MVTRLLGDGLDRTEYYKGSLLPLHSSLPEAGEQRPEEERARRHAGDQRPEEEKARTHAEEQDTQHETDWRGDRRQSTGDQVTSKTTSTEFPCQLCVSNQITAASPAGSTSGRRETLCVDPSPPSCMDKGA